MGNNERQPWFSTIGAVVPEAETLAAAMTADERTVLTMYLELNGSNHGEGREGQGALVPSLFRLVVEDRDYSAEDHRYLMRLRGLHGVLNEICVNENRQTGVGSLPDWDMPRQKAARLYQHACRTMQIGNPLPRSHPSYSRRVQRVFVRFRDLLNGTNAAALKRYSRDQNIPAARRAQVTFLVMDALRLAWDLLESTRMERQLTPLILPALQEDDGSVLGVCGEIMKTATQLFGDTPMGTDSLSMGILRLYARTQVQNALHGGAGEIRSATARVLEHYGRIAGADARQRLETAAQTGARADVEAAGDALIERAQGGVGLTALVTVINMVLLGAAYARDPPTESFERVLESAQLAGDTASTAGSVYILADRMVQRAIAGSAGAIAVEEAGGAAARAAAAGLPWARTRAFLDVTGRVVRGSEAAVCRTMAVVGLVAGVYHTYQGFANDEPMGAIVGGVETLAGIAAVCGVLFSVPGAQPLAIVLGLTAALVGAVDAERPYNHRVVLSMIEQAAQHRNSERICYAELYGLTGMLDELRSAVNHSRLLYGRLDPFAPHARGDQQALRNAMRAHLLIQLQSYGIPNDVAAQMVGPFSDL